ncbi:hypothetical protein HanIR_Chr05g0221421 [Helianthus annuus]|nr:hypothetical protein HanIR_Chr05g0221421 [Helianthus annuus]
MVAVKRVAGSRSSRQVHDFYGCLYGLEVNSKSDSKFFVWKEDVDVNSYGKGKSNLVEINKELQIKIANLEIEKIILMEENTKLKKRWSRCYKHNIYCC